eukprot:CAMPEP_0194766448 /NCGR_PEP_ID=MMETSP0323_2-20130528/31442_1 /TAXON_ID=2866 ORGANISM="Crypthecodinium cohnii, Strain Seligo" /NCGR_SAMPLE_ID=MMETSP0323_2 /ASSEMBLY_ACC=CAM_ASM_000346 /LENGTH=31 /DNA_ID= /DNA_START= /DNA_END= /DNA_ORIENTATION=
METASRCPGMRQQSKVTRDTAKCSATLKVSS